MKGIEFLVQKALSTYSTRILPSIVYLIYHSVTENESYLRNSAIKQQNEAWCHSDKARPYNCCSSKVDKQ